MINKINSLKKIAKFDEFLWHTSTDEFSKLNIIFGYNGSGKTALSNVFRLFSKQIEDESDLLFKEISNDSSSFVEITYDKRKIRYDIRVDKKNIYVFNSDFIADHVYDGTKANIKEFDSSVVTQEQLKNPKIIGLENEIKKYEKENEIILQKKELLDKKFIDIRSELSKELNEKIVGTRFHKVDKHDLTVENTEAKVRNKLNCVFSDFEMSGKQDELNSDIAALKSIKFDTVKINLDSSKAAIKKDISEISRKRIEKKIENLSKVKLEKYSLNDWFDDALSLLKSDSIQERKICPLCDSNIRNRLEELIKDYEAYFSEEYKNLTKLIENQLQIIDKDVTVFNINDINLERFIQYRKKYLSSQIENEKSFTLNHNNIFSVMNEHKKSLINKKKDISIKIIDTKFMMNFQELINKYNSDVKKIEKQYTQLVNDLESKSYDPKLLKNEARDLSRDLLYIKFDSFCKDNKINSYETLESAIDALNKQISDLNIKKRNIVASLKNESKFINFYLLKLGVFNFTVDINNDELDENIQISYIAGCVKNKIRHSLSEGEKTALAFSYFVSKIRYEVLDNSQVDIKNTIIVIDDPISSLDQSRLYSTACLINRTFSKAEQLFIFSHNIVFLKFIGNLFGTHSCEIISNNKSEKVSCRKDYFLSMTGQLTILPESLSNYNTVYFQKVFDILKYNNGEVDYEEAKIYLPNHIRVVLETFLSFKFYLLKQGSSSDKYRTPGIDKIIKVLESKTHLFRDYPSCNDINKTTIIPKLEQIRRIIDPQTHGTPQNIDEFCFISESELNTVVTDTLSIICFFDKIQYEEIINRSK